MNLRYHRNERRFTADLLIHSMILTVYSHHVNFFPLKDGSETTSAEEIHHRGTEDTEKIRIQEGGCGEQGQGIQ